MDNLRIEASEVRRRMCAGEPLIFVDSRNRGAWDSSERQLPHAVRVPPDEIDEHAHELPHGRMLVAYCTCPSEASSVQVAQGLRARGHKESFALLGGMRAWQEAGYGDEPKAARVAGLESDAP
jgi:rhodanese-related sulfurtransferase